MFGQKLLCVKQIQCYMTVLVIHSL